MADQFTYSASGVNSEKGYTGAVISPASGGANDTSSKVLANSPVGYWRLNEAPSGYEAYVLSLSPQVFYRMNENSGTTLVDASGNVINGTYSGSPTFQQDGAVMADPNKSVSFSSANPDVGTVPVADFDFDKDGEFTFCFWMKTSSLISLEAIMAQSNGDPETIGIEYWMFYTNTLFGTMRLNFAADGGVAVNAVDDSVAINDGEWHFVSLKRVNIAPNMWFNLFVDGNWVTPVDLNLAHDLAVTSDMMIGSDAYIGGLVDYNGQLDEIMYFKSALSDAQIEEIYDLSRQKLATDSSTNTLTSTYQGNMELQQSSSLQGTPTDYSVDMHGASNYVLVSDNAALDITADLTLEAWIKLDATPAATWGIVAKDELAANKKGYTLGITSAKKLYLNIERDGDAVAGGLSLTGQRVLDVGTWYHVVGTYDPSTSMRLYINGMEDASVTAAVPTSIHSDTNDLWLGIWDDLTTANQYFDGLLNEVAVYNSVLTPTQILDHYRSGPYKVVGDSDELDYSDDYSTLYVRFKINPGTLAGGSVGIIEAFDSGDKPVVSIDFDSSNDTISVLSLASSTLSSSINSSGWSTVEVYVNGTDITLYIDGDSVATGSSASTINIASVKRGVVYRGYSVTGSCYIDGLVVSQSQVGENPFV
jgi:hypothetical protein